MRTKLLVLAIAVVIIAGVGIILLGKKTQPGIGQAPTVINAMSSTASTTTIAQGGANASFMSEAEAAELVGSGGIYSVTEYSSVVSLPTSAFDYLKDVPNATAYFQGKIEGLWNVSYTNQAENAAISETVVQSTVANALYADLPTHKGNGQSAWNATNQTYDGMKFSYYTEIINNVTYVDMAGYKDNEMTVVLAYAKIPLNLTLLARTVAGDMK